MQQDLPPPFLSKKLPGKCRHFDVCRGGMSQVRHSQNDEVPIRRLSSRAQALPQPVTDHELGTQSAWLDSGDGQTAMR